MLNQKKIRIMTRLASTERKEEKNALRLAHYFRVDYVRFEMLKTAVAVTIAYTVIIGMGICFYAEELMKDFMTIPYRELLGKIGIGYTVLLAVYVLAAGVGYFIKYNMEYKKTKHYLQLLRLYRRVCVTVHR